MDVKTTPAMSYEESVQWVRRQPDLQHLVETHYLDADNAAAARRFAASEEFGEIVKLLGLKSAPPQKILDLGCGNGIVSSAFAALGHAVSAADPDTSDDVGLGAAERLAARVSPPGSITTARAFAEDLPYDDNTFDIVYARQAMHHFSDLEQAVAECWRVLRPGGVFLGTREHVADNDNQRAYFLDNHPLHKLHGGENAHSLARYTASLEQAGFTIIKRLGCYDTPINMQPGDNAFVQKRFCANYVKRFGPPGALLCQIPVLKTRYRARLSAQCDMGGRLYTFLARANKS